MIPPDLPITACLPALRAALAAGRALVLEAPPGAGKTTAVPLALLNEPWLAGRRIVMLEPRRLAARAAARRMAELLGETVGETVGYRVRFDARTGPRTRIEIVTDGIFNRMIQDDPALDEYGLVLFDEFHERSLDCDLGLALALDSAVALAEHLRLGVMSATLDGAPIADLLQTQLGGAVPVIRAEGRMYPVGIIHLEKPLDTHKRFALEDATAAAIRRALAERVGDILAFLPGMAEIRRTAERLSGVAAVLHVLHGDVPAAAQDAAITPDPGGRRKIVLASAIAETSLTIDGVRVVVDAGLARRLTFDPGSGMARLVTQRLSLAAATQRAGRAGRLAPGTCYRLWTAAEERGLRPFAPAEILAADLAPLALDLARWGVQDPAALPWLDAPPPGALAQARGLLADLGALDEAGRITAAGQAMARLPTHPRLAHMICAGAADGLGGLACDVAALLSERDVLPGGRRDADLRSRLALLTDNREAGRVRDIARQLRRLVGAAAGAGRGDATAVGRLLARAYPDRVAERRGTGYRLSGGRGAKLPDGDALAVEPYLAIADLDGGGVEATIRLAAPISAADIETLFADRLTPRQVLDWDGRDRVVTARRQRRLGALVLEDKPLPDPDPALVRAALLGGIAREGLGPLPWTPAAESLRQRVGFLRRTLDDADPPWPDWSDDALLAGLSDWLGPHLEGMSRAAHLARLDLAEILRAALPWPMPRDLDALAPTHWEVPSGSLVRLDYSGAEPVLAVKLQEMFGALDTPRIAGGRVPLLIHLLSPAGRPVQVTRDLPGFWRSGYFAVRADLRGRYPRHPWPDDPLSHVPTKRTRNALGRA